MRGLMFLIVVLCFGSLANAQQCSGGVCTYSGGDNSTSVPDVASDLGIVARIATAPGAAVAAGRVSVRAVAVNTRRVFANRPVRGMLARIFGR